MKNIFLIGGTMGVGKTTTCQLLKNSLSNSVFLDGDWCWDMHPFQVTEETKHMVIENICFLLNSFIKCSAYQNIIFCWVMHQQNIIDEIIFRLKVKNSNIYSITLTCEEQILYTRLKKDIDRGIRTEDVIGRSIEYIPFYENLNTYKIDVSNMNPQQVAKHIESFCKS